jgi:hypothetical protein
MEWQSDEERAFCLGLGYGRVPFGELCRAERGLDALVSGMRAGAGIGRQLRQHVHPAALSHPDNPHPVVHPVGDIQMTLRVDPAAVRTLETSGRGGSAVAVASLVSTGDGLSLYTHLTLPTKRIV